MKIDRMNKGSWGKVRAFFDLQTEEGFTIKGFKLVEGMNGLFVGFPSQKGNDEEYRDTVWADRDLKEQVNQLAVKAYGQEIMNPVPEENSKEEFVPPTPSTEDVSVEPFSDDDIPF